MALHDPAAISTRCAATVDYALGLDVPNPMERALRDGDVWDEPETGPWRDEPMDMSALKSFWRDPAPYIAEERRRRAQFDAAMAPHDARVRAAQEARWAEDALS